MSPRMVIQRVSVQHRDVDKVAFTGSTAAGRQIKGSRPR
jgi:acyl-CoA reductase-like NAD-dependent aldehyde dehydrogenase